MTLKAFIAANRGSLVLTIQDLRDRVPATASCYCYQSGSGHTHRKPVSDADIHAFISNNEGMYNWARSYGVRI